MSAVAEKAERIKKVFLTQTIKDGQDTRDDKDGNQKYNGVVELKFWNAHKWDHVMIDDYLPVYRYAKYDKTHGT